MTNPKGTKEETNVVRWLRINGWPFARRIRQAGNKDEGDITLGDGIFVAIESKAVRRWDPAGWMREIEAEVTNSSAEWGFVVVKKRGTTDAGEYYVVMPLKWLNTLLVKLYGSSEVSKRRIIRRH